MGRLGRESVAAGAGGGQRSSGARVDGGNNQVAGPIRSPDRDWPFPAGGFTAPDMKTRFLGVLLGGVLLAGGAGCRPSPPATELHQAVQKQDLKAVQQHIAAGSDLNTLDRNGWTALHLAAMRGDLTMVKTLTEGGADVNRSGQGGKTALDMARQMGRVEVAAYLQARPTKGGKGQGRGLVDGGLGVSEVLNNP